MREALIFVSLLFATIVSKVEPAILKAREQFSVKRMACFMVSRYYYYNHKQAIDSIIAQLNNEQQQRFEIKKYPIAIQHCMNLIDFNGAKKLIFEQKEVDFTEQLEVFDKFDYTDILQDPLQMTASQKSLFQFVKKYTEQVQIQREEKEALLREKQRLNKRQIKYFGSSISQIPILAYFICIVTVLIIIFLAIKFSNNKVHDLSRIIKNNEKKNFGKHKKKRK